MPLKRTRKVQLVEKNPKFYHLPKGLPAPLDEFYITTNLDCPCNGHCNITDFSIELFQALHKVRVEFRHPITIIRAYECSNHGDDQHSVAHTKGQALTLQSSDNQRLFKIFSKHFRNYCISVDELFVYISHDVSL